VRRCCCGCNRNAAHTPQELNGDGLTGVALPEIRTAIPGPQSRALAARLQRVESRNITALTPVPPIFWAEARGANVRDVDGNTFIDLTSGFGVAIAGHANEAVVAAIAQQSAKLPHALGDVYPAAAKVQLLERLAAILPASLEVSILANSGSEAVEAALKTALMRTGRNEIIAFENSYHGLTYGALATTHRRHFREPFNNQLFSGVHFVPFADERADLAAILRQIDHILGNHEVGAIIIEPIQGRGGIVVPHDEFLRELRARCDGETRVLIFDEVYTGCGRTGTWLACEHWQVIPDIVVLGKGLSGALPISACVGTAEVMSAWPASTGEAIHTTTFLGNPIACAAALAQLNEIERLGLLQRATELAHKVRDWGAANGLSVRGRGLIQGVVLASGDVALNVCAKCLDAGIILLTEGAEANVLAITPPSVITEAQLAFALSKILAILSGVSP
jgi:4-aminobutyrate aminotransferase-like enzyme